MVRRNSHYRGGDNSNFWKVVCATGAIGLGGLGVWAGYDAIKTKYDEKKALEKRQEMTIERENNFYDSFEIAMGAGNYSNAEKFLKKAEGMREGIQYNSEQMSLDAKIIKQVLIDKIKAEEDARLKNIDNLKSQFGQVDPDTGEKNYSVIFGDNLVKISKKEYTARNDGVAPDMDNPDVFREVYNNWSYAYDKLVGESNNPDSLEIGDIVSLRGTYGEKINSQLNVEKNLKETVSKLLDGKRKALDSDYEKGHEYLSNVLLSLRSDAFSSLDKKLSKTFVNYEDGNIEEATNSFSDLPLISEDYVNKVNKNVKEAKNYLNKLIEKKEKLKNLNSLLEQNDFEGLSNELSENDSLANELANSAERSYERKEKEKFSEANGLFDHGSLDGAFERINEVKDLHNKGNNIRIMAEDVNQMADYDAFSGQINDLLIDRTLEESKSFVSEGKYDEALVKVEDVSKYGADLEGSKTIIQTLIDDDKNVKFVASVDSLSQATDSLIVKENFADAKDLVEEYEVSLGVPFDSLKTKINDAEEIVLENEKLAKIDNLRYAALGEFRERNYEKSLELIVDGEELGGSFDALRDSITTKYAEIESEAYLKSRELFNQKDFSGAREELNKSVELGGADKYQSFSDSLSTKMKISKRFDEFEGVPTIVSRADENVFDIAKLRIEFLENRALDVRVENGKQVGKDLRKLHNFVLDVLKDNNMEQENPYETLDERIKLKLPM